MAASNIQCLIADVRGSIVAITDAAGAGILKKQPFQTEIVSFDEVFLMCI